MFNAFRGILLFMFIILGIDGINAITSQQVSKPKDTVIIQSGRRTYIPFTFFNPPAFQIVNNRLNIAIADRTGDMIQINNIDIQQLKTGILPKSAYRVVYISSKRGTLSDDKDTNPSSILEIKCADNKPGTPITIGLKSSVRNSKQSYRLYATLSGKMPSYLYQSTVYK